MCYCHQLLDSFQKYRPNLNYNKQIILGFPFLNYNEYKEHKYNIRKNINWSGFYE